MGHGHKGCVTGWNSNGRLIVFWPKEAEGEAWGNQRNEKSRDYPEERWPEFCVWTLHKADLGLEHSWLSAGYTPRTGGSAKSCEHPGVLMEEVGIPESVPQGSWGTTWDLHCHPPQVRQSLPFQFNQVNCLLRKSVNNVGMNTTELSLDYKTFNVQVIIPNYPRQEEPEKSGLLSREKTRKWRRRKKGKRRRRRRWRKRIRTFQRAVQDVWDNIKKANI